MPRRDPPPERSYRGRSAAERRAERRERLMAAGLDLFGTEGYTAISIERLCTTAGVSTRNFYEEFPNREALLIALHDRITHRAAGAVTEALADAEDADLARRIELSARAYLATTASDPRWARIAHVEVVGVSTAVEQHRLEWRRRWTEFLEAEATRAVQPGEACERDYHLTAVAFIGAVNELVYHWSIHGRRPSLDDLTAELVRLAVGILMTP
ncbi:MAG: TetR family transcriptional regulator [Streptosporangiales bacterium]|nr:TetR family transcriptional regulator [Streptosporangiales bacterium]